MSIFSLFTVPEFRVASLLQFFSIKFCSIDDDVFMIAGITELLGVVKRCAAAWNSKAEVSSCPR